MKSLSAYLQEESDGEGLLHDGYLPERSLWLHVVVRALWDWREFTERARVEWTDSDGELHVDGEARRQVGELEVWARQYYVGSLLWIADHCSPNPSGFVKQVRAAMHRISTEQLQCVTARRKIFRIPIRFREEAYVH